MSIAKLKTEHAHALLVLRQQKLSVKASKDKHVAKAWFDAENEKLNLEYDMNRFNVMLQVEDDEGHAKHLESEIKRFAGRIAELEAALPELREKAGVT